MFFKMVNTLTTRQHSSRMHTAWKLYVFQFQLLQLDVTSRGWSVTSGSGYQHQTFLAGLVGILVGGIPGGTLPIS